MTVHTKQPATAEAAGWGRMKRRNRLLTIAVAVLAAGLIVVGGWLINELTSGSSSDLRGDFPTGTFVAGDRTVEFNEDGTCRWFPNTESWELPCKYAVNGDLYTEMWFDWPSSTTERFPATYYWTFDGTNLTFELWGHDANASRRAVYGRTLVRSD